MDFCPLFITINTSVCLGLLILSIILPLIHTLFLAKAQGKFPNIYGIMLKYGLFINIGSVFFFIAVGNFMYGAYVAQCLDWQRSLFQYEVATSQLGIAFLGFLTILFNRYFWLATLIVSTIWLWGAAIVHLVHGMQQPLFPYHLAIIVGWEVVVPVYLISLYVLYRHSKLSHKIREL